MLVRIHKGRMAYFRRKAKQCYPNEILAFLIGKQVHKGLIEVHHLYYAQLVTSTPNNLKTTDGAPQEAEEFAKEKDMQVVGDIHTHPDYPPVMSGADHRDHKCQANKITAILEVPKDGRTRLVIWRDGTPLPCKIEFL